jgi:hypothetical protein
MAAGSVRIAAQTAASRPVAGSRSWLDGVWRTTGYGMVLTVGGGHGTVYQTTAISCLFSGKADQLGPPGKDGVVDFGAGGVATTTVRPAGAGRAWLHPLGSAGDIGMRRIRALPRSCTRSAPKDPVADFNIFWTTFAENYPFFAAQKISWRAVYARYRPLVTARTTDLELYQILVDMLRPLGNAHTYVISADDQYAFEGLRPGTRPWSATLCGGAARVTDARLGSPLRTWGRGNIAFAELRDRLGYLRISAFEDYAGSSRDVRADQTVLGRALKAIFTRARTSELRGLIIDVRCNPGGDDSLGLQVASRLTGHRYLAYTKRARGPGGPGRLTAPQPITVRPAGGPDYTGPIAILTSDLTNSAGETFTQAMIDRTPRPVRIGLATQGVFSDILNRALPDGIMFGLPNEEFLTRAGRTFDNRGIPPDIRTPVFTSYDLSHERDPALAAARAVLTALCRSGPGADNQAYREVRPGRAVRGRRHGRG